MKKIFFLILLSSGMFLGAMAQDDKPVPQEKETKAKPKYTRATFKSTRIINLQSVEMVSKGNLQLLISHHFGYIWDKEISDQQNFANLFGLNSGTARTYVSLDYSPRNWCNLGLAMAGYGRYEGWLKLKLLRQQTGETNIPVTVGWYSMFSVNASKNTENNNFFWNKFTYLHQLMIARKFSDKFSLQVMPGIVYYNIVPYGYNNSNAIFTLGAGAKYRAFKKTAITLEYARQFNMYKNIVSKTGELVNYKPDMISVGLEFDTGGHLFQVYAGTATSASNIEQLSRSTNSSKFALGFTINRSFRISN